MDADFFTITATVKKNKRPFPAETSGKGRGLTTLFLKKLLLLTTEEIERNNIIIQNPE
ncbi:hypothetical protein IC801_07380 [Geobacillus sp. 44B]|nr:hypothetical protein IC801_07380 [Geobacillus sp. 44B]